MDILQRKQAINTMAAMKIPGDVDPQEYVKLLTVEVKKQGYKSQGARVVKICDESEDRMIKMTISFN